MEADPRLTVTAGVRYLFAPLPNFAVPLSNFDPAVYNPADAPIVNPSGTIAATLNYNPANGIVIGRRHQGDTSKPQQQAPELL